VTYMIYFGFRPRPAEYNEIPVPLGLSCLLCGKHFVSEDRGIITPWSTEVGEACCGYHLECFTGHVLGYEVDGPAR
jgi:hypothetical protein